MAKIRSTKWQGVGIHREEGDLPSSMRPCRYGIVPVQQCQKRNECERNFLYSVPCIPAIVILRIYHQTILYPFSRTGMVSNRSRLLMVLIEWSSPTTASILPQAPTPTTTVESIDHECGPRLLDGMVENMASHFFQIPRYIDIK